MARLEPGNKPKPLPALLGLNHRRGEAKLPRMKIGILSDTHNHLRETRRALDLLVKQGARHLVHCGDAGEEVVDLLAAVCLEHGIRAHVAIGNCDRGHGADARFAPQPAGIERGVSPEFILAGQALHRGAWGQRLPPGECRRLRANSTMCSRAIPTPRPTSGRAKPGC